MIFWLYSALLTCAAVLLAPRALLRAQRRKDALPDLRHRLGFLPPLGPGAPTIWIHAVSVGEVLSTQPLVEKLRANLSPLRLVISTVTATGQQIARNLYSQDAITVYFPFDWAFSVRRALDRINPDLVLIMETEIWPRFLHECRQRGISVILINGRISQRSFNGYRRLGRFAARILNDFSYLLMQSEEDASRVLALGADPKRVVVVGNMKWDVSVSPEEEKKLGELSHLFSLSEQSSVIVAASTAEGEEEIILSAFKKLLENSSSLRTSRLVIAPRRPERFDHVGRIIRASGLSFARRTRTTSPSPDTTVILLDTLGELPAFYHIASVAVLGGSLLGSARHNIAEPLLRGCPVIVGPGFPESAIPKWPETAGDLPPVTRLAPASRSRSEDLASALATAISLYFPASRNGPLHQLAWFARRYYQGATERCLAYITAALTSRHPSGMNRYSSEPMTRG
ncbi:MAG TPA: 3-deoxy-D-manno-octulosonic acid transferase [Blastocatellia bacterium]|nr:3-deoxy-D-manno-octulosonic acid transferase [Blastocatellia bacterium]